jgi:hypothetical protein
MEQLVILLPIFKREVWHLEMFLLNAVTRTHTSVHCEFHVTAAGKYVSCIIGEVCIRKRGSVLVCAVAQQVTDIRWTECSCASFSSITWIIPCQFSFQQRLVLAYQSLGLVQ